MTPQDPSGALGEASNTLAAREGDVSNLAAMKQAIAQRKAAAKAEPGKPNLADVKAAIANRTNGQSRRASLDKTAVGKERAGGPTSGRANRTELVVTPVKPARDNSKYGDAAMSAAAAAILINSDVVMISPSPTGRVVVTEEPRAPHMGRMVLVEVPDATSMLEMMRKIISGERLSTMVDPVSPNIAMTTIVGPATRIAKDAQTAMETAADFEGINRVSVLMIEGDYLMIHDVRSLAKSGALPEGQLHPLEMNGNGYLPQDVRALTNADMIIGGASADRIALQVGGYIQAALAAGDNSITKARILHGRAVDASMSVSDLAKIVRPNISDAEPLPHSAAVRVRVSGVPGLGREDLKDLGPYGKVINTVFSDREQTRGHEVEDVDTAKELDGAGAAEQGIDRATLDSELAAMRQAPLDTFTLGA